MKDNSKSKNLKGKDNLVLTPGGLRPKDLVHYVRSDEAVQFGANGTHTIRNLLNPLRAADAEQLRSQGLVLTPGGYRHPSLVHKVDKGEILRITDQAITIYDKKMVLRRKVDLLQPKTGPIPSLGSGWISFASWTNNIGTPISSFSTSWVVPSESSTKGSQTIFLFNGIDPSNHSKAILQPVLQWGSSYAGGGKYWSIASWYVLDDGNAFYTNLIPVKPLDELVGLMTLTGQANGKFSYRSEFVGFANSVLTIQDVDELVWCNETLEAYSIEHGSDYPNTPYTAFQQIQIQTGASTPTLSWSPQNWVTNCGQDSAVASNANPGGEVDIFYAGRPSHDLYIRDNLLDFGAEPLISGGLSCSPDIVVFNEELLDPQATLGSATAQGQDTLGDQVESGQDNFLYFRVQNRGSQPADGKIKAYWANLSTWPIPGGWKLIDEIPIPSVAPGEFKVVGPMTWFSGDIPPIGHYCFLSLIDRADDPAPDPSNIQSWDDYYRFIRQNNNATWKNFNVVPLLPGTYTTSSFQIHGWPRIKLSSDLLIDLSPLPNEIGVTLRILKRLAIGSTFQNMELFEESSLYRRYKLQAEKVSAIRNMHLKTSDITEATLEITIPDKTANGYYRISAAQLVDGREMGRVTSVLAIGPYPFTANTKTKELHIPGCDWAAKISPRHKVPYDNAARAIKHGFNGCRFCLPEYNTD